jgi:hypothetical protein
VNSAVETIAQQVRRRDFTVIAGHDLFSVLDPSTADAWPGFAQSWNTLGDDLHMADGGRYRRRRHGVFSVARDQVSRRPHQPHFQQVTHNRLNGGVDRWFDAIDEAVGASPPFLALLRLGDDIFRRAAAEAAPQTWRVEAHQFRIEARPGQHGLPTPEGMHRDGVDYVLVVLIGRTNVREGATILATPDADRSGNSCCVRRGTRCSSTTARSCTASPRSRFWRRTSRGFGMCWWSHSPARTPARPDFRIHTSRFVKSPCAFTFSLPPQWGKGGDGGVSTSPKRKPSGGAARTLSAFDQTTPPSQTLPPLREKGFQRDASHVGRCESARQGWGDAPSWALVRKSLQTAWSTAAGVTGRKPNVRPSSPCSTSP